MENSRKTLFCDGNEQFQEKILNILSPALFNENAKGKLRHYFEDIRQNYDCEYAQCHFNNNYQLIEEENDPARVLIPVSDSSFELQCCNQIGHDLPTWFNINAKKKIMIIAQDPLRTGRYNSENNIILSTPFGLHSKKWREAGNKGKRYSEIVDRLLKQDVGIYLTDFMKLYVGSGKFEMNGIIRKFEDILAKEIELIKPELIITFGRKATECLMPKCEIEWFKPLTYENYLLLPMIHPSYWGRNNNKIITTLNCDKVFTGKDFAEPYAEVIIKSLEKY